MTTAPIRLSAHDLCIDLSGKRVLDGLDLSLHDGELLVLVGPNGSGKSTALRSLAGLLEPRAGEVRLDDQPLARLPPLQRARALAYLPQDFRSQWDLDVAELLALGASRGGRSAEGKKPAMVADELVDSLDIGALLTRRLSQLSGGERARAAIGWALAAGSPLLLADEPTAALDVGHQLALMRYLRTRLPGCSMLLVLHDLGLAMRFADRIAILSGGRLLYSGTPEQVRHSGALEQAFASDILWTPTPEGFYPIVR
ncbi:ABC transporter ATP-binding protein [Pseudomonas sp. ABC1]|uniref:ABC transporter ATP-binding protein n=1 Tax=Pseudomonas sp. ABC1 TaxID=2748080 RepID=UPI0015C35FD3|nr:ABC transporter ATP-binding protein [Pseudomonas sp. ABC1]QLF92147.1 ABC transporter ATP-binding protein [Pseudomonas sp. ABC1]